MIPVRRRGYILVETAVALVLLSIGSLAVHRTIQEAIRTRGQAQDFTRARFLVNGTLSDILAQPLLVERRESGHYAGSDSRFSWTSEIRRVNIPPPGAPLRPPPAGTPAGPFEFPEGSEFLVRVSVTISWTRSGLPFSASLETLLPPGRLWQPPRTPQRR